MSEPVRPTSVSDAVEILYDILSPFDRNFIRECPRERLIQWHFSLGMYIRNSFGLWGDNVPLLRDSGHEHPDDCSQLIIEKLWERLQETTDETW